MERSRRVKLLREYYRQCQQVGRQWGGRGYAYPPPKMPLFPEICRGMKCEAKTRRGKACQNDGAAYPSGRCKFHGGASTGPRTPSGKQIAAANGRKSKPHGDLTKVNLDERLTAVPNLPTIS